MKKKTMRLLAFMLAVVMVICMAPLASAEGEATTDGMSGVKIVYSLKSPSGAQVNVDTFGYKETHGFWEYYSVAKGYENAYRVATKDYLSMHSYGANNGYVALMINVPAKGKYDVLLNYCSNTTGVEQGTIHIIPATVADIESAIDSGNYLAVSNINYYSSSKITGNEANGSCTIENAGEHYLVFSQANEYNASKAVIRPESLTLNGGVNTVPMISSLTATENNGVTTVKAEATLMSDGAPVTEPVTYSYAVAEDDAKFASVDPTTGVVTGKINATATIIATATVGSYSSSKSIEVPVTNPNMSGIKVVYEFKSHTGDVFCIKDVPMTYETTKGFWKYHSVANDNMNSLQGAPNYLALGGYGKNGYVAVVIDVPVKGDYSVSYKNWTRKRDGLKKGGIHIIPVSENLKESVDNRKYIYADNINYNNLNNTGEVEATTDLGTISFEAGEYYVVFSEVEHEENMIMRPMSLTLEGGTNAVPMVNITSAPEHIEIGKNANITAEAALMSDGTAASGVDIAYSVAEDDKLVAEVSENGVITGKAKGTATIIATATKDGLSSSKSIEVDVTAPEVGETITNTNASVSALPNIPASGTVAGLGTAVDSVKMGTTVNLTATANEGYVFRYWKNAAGQVLSDKASESFVINTNSAITAVFDKVDENADTVSVELYNANGMPFDSKNVNKGTTFADAITGVGTPTYTGFGAFKHWSMYEDESKINDNMLVKENTRAVAIFNAPTEEYTVSVNGTPVHSDVLYGTEVTVSSTDSDFSCWKLGNEIVSYNPNYKFTVWGDVDLTEVKEGNVTAAPVAMLTTVGLNPLLIYSVPAGYTVVEAGILFGSTANITISSVDGGRAAAARGTGQFTAQPKAGTTPAYSRGYLIFKNNTTGEIRVLYAE